MMCLQKLKEFMKGYYRSQEVLVQINISGQLQELNLLQTADIYFLDLKKKFSSD